MPRKSTKKDTSAESKAETGTTRRSGRSVTKQESPAAGKEASRSRRGSTAAATAASAADTKSPKGRTSTSRRDSTSPSEGRSHKKRKESEEPSRKTARRAASRVNYKESDGEEEVQAPKFDDAFDSNDEVDDSESDEKSKPKAGRGRAAKAPAKGRGSKGKGRKSRSSKGRSKKESSDEEDEDEPPIELSEDSVEVDEESTGKQAKESTRSSRGKKPKADDSGAKPKSRRSGRAGTKEESPRKRPTRGVQAKKYTEDDDDEIEEIDDDKEEEKIEGGRKRKRSSESEPNKRLKDDDDDDAAEEEKDDDGVEKDEKSSDPKDEPEKDEEPMEIDDEKKDETSAKKLDKESDDSAQKADEAPEAGSTEKESSPEKKEDVEDLEEDMHDSNEDDSEDAEEAKIDEKDVEETKTEKSKIEVEDTLDSSNSIEEIEKSSESKTVSETVSNDPRSTQDSTETNAEKRSTESFQNDISPDSRSGNDSEKQPLPVSNESNSEVSVNGSEKPLSNTAPVIQTTNSVNLHDDEEPAPTENGAHDLHNNSVSESDQYYPFPGRKYVVNTKLGESIRQSVKEKSFGFVSYNLGLSSSDSSIPKEKLLNELNKLDAHIICIQQVSKQFYCSILEPSLDALGFKGTFSLPGENMKGVATFYKSSLFRLSGQSEASLKHLIEKELETPTLDTNDKMVVKTHVKQCGHVLFTHFATVIGMHSLTVANVQIPPSDLSVHALQVSCLAKEVARVNGGNNKPFLLGGEFNMLENEAPYQLLKDGYLSNDMIEELQRRKDIALPGKESDALVNILWKSYQHPSSTLCSCYKSVLDHEVFIPEQKGTSPDLLWYSSDSLFTIGVLDASETAGDRHFSLKADIAFSM